MEKCKWYGCLAGSGPQSQWLASTRRQWVTLLILDRRQVGAGVRSDGEAEVIVYNLSEIRCCDQKWHSALVFFFLPLSRSNKRPAERMEQCHHPNRTAQNGSFLLYCAKVWQLNKRVGCENTHSHANTKVLPSLDLWFPASVSRCATEPYPARFPPENDFMHLLYFTSA